MTEWLIAIGFAAAWIITFKPAWRLLIRLVVRASQPDFSLRDGRFWLDFVLYRLVIFAPYLIPLFFAQRLPNLFVQLIWAWIGLSIILSFGRIIGVNQLVSALWWVYGWVYDGLLHFYPYRHLLELALRRLKLQKGQVLLDVGCGTGNLMKLVESRHAGVKQVGVDDSASMLRQARRKLNRGATLKKADVIDFLREQPSHSYDRLSLVNVAYAVSQRQELWKQSLRVLKPGGRIVMTTSIAAGSGPIVREHLAHDSRWQLFYPKLVAVGVIDLLISELSRTTVFEFPSREQLIAEIETAGGKMSEVERCYGGSENGVNIICTITHA